MLIEQIDFSNNCTNEVHINENLGPSNYLKQGNVLQTIL